MHKTLDSLPLPKPDGMRLGPIVRAAAKLGAANDKPKTQASIPKIKQVHKLITALGQTVTGVTLNGDGGFTITATDPAQAQKTLANPWDEVLK